MSKKVGVKKGSYQAETFAKRNQRRIEAERITIYQDGMQNALDVASLVLHDIYGFGPERLKRFAEGFEKKFSDVQKINRADKDDKDAWYSRQKFEEAMKEAWGEYYVSREIRYDET